MEPIKINVVVGLHQSTLDLLDRVIWAMTQQAKTTALAPTQEQNDPQPESPQPDPAPKRKARKSEPAPETSSPVQDPEPAPADDDDLPPDDAPDPKKPAPTEDDARKAVKAARDRGVPAKVIKEFMKESFNIASSVECPAERRQELIEGLNKLAA